MYRDNALLPRLGMLAAGLTVLALLAACGGGNGSASAGGVDRSAITEGLASGEYEINLDGAVSRLGSYEGERGPYDFAPASGGTNANGPYRVRVRTRTQFGDDQRVAYLLIVLPAGTEAGRHELTALRDAGDDDAHAMFRATGQAWNFARDVSGHIDIAEIGDVLTAAYAVEMADGDGNTVRLDGRMKGIPFQPQAETDTRITIDGEEEHFEGGSIRAAYGELRIGPTRSAIGVTLPESVEPGTYDLAAGFDGDGLRVSLYGASGRIDELDGTITFEETGNTFSGSFEFTASGDHAVDAKGVFEGLEL